MSYMPSIFVSCNAFLVLTQCVWRFTIFQLENKALVKGAVGALAGGVVGLIFFKGGKGARAASIATGFGAGIGSTWERVRHRYERSDEKAATN